MKRLFLLTASLALCISAYAVSGAHASKKMYSNSPIRTNFILPTVDGLNCYTADLHVHTFFSDGEVSPAERVKEAWIDGLDILAITDHIETRRYERTMLKFLKGYSANKEGFDPINTRCSRGQHADERGIVSDLNLSVNLALKAAENYPEITIIKGTEISREPEHIGHYCALFTKDNNTIYSTDDAQAIRNARAQGALITHNHPGWERLSTAYTEFEKKIYAEGLIDGIEVTNGKDFYPEIVRRAVEKKLYMVSATDIHATTASIYGKQKIYRDMTLIFASDKSEEALRKAFGEQKTLGYCGGYIIGEESLLKKFFVASVSAKYAGSSRKGDKIVLTNHTSFDYVLKHNGRVWSLPALQSITIPLFGKEPIFSVENTYHMDEQHLVVKLEVAK